MIKKYLKPAVRIVTVQQRMSLLADSLHLHNEVVQGQLSRKSSSSWDDEVE